MQQHIFITDSDFANTDSNFQYLLGFQPSLGAMILSDRELIVFLDGRYFSKTKDVDIEKIKHKTGNADLEVRFVEFRDMIENMLTKITAVDVISLQDNIAVKYYQEIQSYFPSSEIRFVSSYFQKQREIKTFEEKNNIIEAIKVIDQVFLYIESMIESGEILGQTELQIRQQVMQKIFEFGGQGESFETIIAFGKNSAVPHHVSGDTVIAHGVLLIDMGAKYKGYCSDFTRTIWVGEKTGQYQEFQKAYEVVYKSHNAVKNGYKPGMTGADLDSIAREVIQNSQYKDLFIHNLGHSLGIDIHEEPRLKKSDTTVLREGMVFTVEPGIYIENNFGIRLEDIVFIEEGVLQTYTSIDL